MFVQIKREKNSRYSMGLISRRRRGRRGRRWRGVSWVISIRLSSCGTVGWGKIVIPRINL
jgi:hypothetical protein